MGDNFKKFVIFVTGAAFGSVVSWKLLKTKFEQIAQEEIDSVKDVYSTKKKVNSSNTEDSSAKDEFKDEDVDDYRSKVDSLGYTNYSDIGKQKAEPKSEFDEEPYVIPDEEFDVLEGYAAETLYYYFGDGFLVDKDDIPIQNIEDVVGYDSLENLGVDDDCDDAVYVRNDRLKKDFEILLCDKNYRDEEDR